MKIKFMPQNIEVDATPDKSLLQIATENNIEIKSICKGIPSCAECRVRILEGEGNILPPGKAELDLIGTSYFIDSRRLSCQVRCFGDVTIDLTEQVERQANQVRKTRGFRSTKPIESKAVQDTMILNPGEKVADQSPERREASEGQVSSEPRQDKRPPGGDGGRRDSKNQAPREAGKGGGGGEGRGGGRRGGRGGRGRNRNGGGGGGGNSNRPEGGRPPKP